MFAVGALDAYFCDANTDVVAATANSKSRQSAVALPEWVYDIKLPLRAVLEEYDNTNWRWRMAARKMMERENVISLSAVQSLFNKFFRKGHKFFRDLLDGWMARPDSKIRLFGVSRADYTVMAEADKHLARARAINSRTGSGPSSSDGTTASTTAAGRKCPHSHSIKAAPS